MSAAAIVASRAASSALRPDERTLLASAGAVFALASAGAAMAGAAGDAMFLGAIGPAHLGGAVALSSALLAGALAVVGGLTDRLERRRVLAGVAFAAAALVVGIAAIAPAVPRIAAVLALIGGKQGAAATDLVFWVAIAERLDARRSRRVLPLLAATGGLGAALGAVLVVPIAGALGARGVLVVAALLLIAAGVGAARLPETARVGAAVPIARGWIVRSWRDGARAVARHPIARHLAIVVGIASLFATLVYFALGVAVSAHGGTTAELAALLGAVRGAGQLATLAVQLLIAPLLFARLGSGRALLVAPAIAVASALGLVAAPVLALAIATQIASKVLDAGVETPAEKLVQTLLPAAVRGRIGGFLDGAAKRAGAIAGGLLAAVLVGAPLAFYVAMAIAAAAWMFAAARIARELPALAIAQVAGERVDDRAGDAATSETVDDRAIAALVAELAHDAPARAAEVLVRLHERGRVDAVPPLVATACRLAASSSTDAARVWRALIAVLDVPADAHGPALLAALALAPREHRALAVRALGLAGGVDAGALAAAAPAGDDDPALALALELARARLGGELDAVAGVMADALREGGAAARAALDELVAELACALAADRNARAGAAERATDAARQLVRAIRRRRGDVGGRVAALTALRAVVEWGRGRRTAELSLLRADLRELARELSDLAKVAAAAASPPLAEQDRAASASERAGALRLLGTLLEHADLVEPDDIRRLTAALGEPDDDVRAAAESALARLGVAAAGELIATAAWGRRRARDRAAALLADLPVTAATLDRLVDAELDALDHTARARAALTAPGDDVIARRLDERLREIAYTVLLLLAARRRSRPIARAAAAWRHARGRIERARTLAVIETALPRDMIRRLVDAVDEPAARRVPSSPALADRDAMIRAELAGGDRLARALVLHAIGAAGRSAHRETITSAAAAEAVATEPLELLRRLTEAVDDPIDEGADVPSRVETLIAIGRVPLFAALTTRQLGDVAERARWVHVAAGALVLGAGDPLDALLVVDDGELGIAGRVIAAGGVVDELACVAPAPLAADLRATRATRLVRLERADFEELVDDVPGLAAAVCRALGERARRADDATYRSPLVSRA